MALPFSEKKFEGHYSHYDPADDHQGNADGHTKKEQQEMEVPVEPALEQCVKHEDAPEI
jgi:hypothetical protein